MKVRALLAGLLVAGMASGGQAPPAMGTLKAGVLEPVLPAPEVSLPGTDGRPLSLARYRGKVVLLAFGYSSCGDVCPITLATMAAARRKLGAAAADVQVIYITVDPERDDVARMKQYLAAFDPTFVGGVGTRAQTDQAQHSYGVHSSKEPGPNGSYTVGHSSSIFMIDRTGGLRAVMPYGRSSDDFVHDLTILLRT